MNRAYVKIAAILGVLYLVQCSHSYRIQYRTPYENDKAQPYTLNYGRPKREQKYYQDVYVAQLIPEVVEFGHVKETPFSWLQRFEKINYAQPRYQGKMKWNNPKDGYGEHYYDYNYDGENSDKDDNKEEKKQTLEDILANGRRLYEKGDVEFIDGKSFDTVMNGKQNYHGGNYKTAPNPTNQRNTLTNDKYSSKCV